MIRKSTFQYCKSLREIIIPAKVEYVYAEAFADCDNLKSVTCLATTPPFAYDNSFTNYDIPLYVPEESIISYQETNPWSKFTQIKTLSGGEMEWKCAKPKIYYNKGELTFGCDTEGVDFKSSITDSDIKDYTSAFINLSVTYHISVYAMKSGYQNSDVAEATLCWIEVDPQKEGITEETATEAKQLKALPVLIQAADGQISVEGAPEGTKVAVYDASGVEMGAAISRGGTTLIPARLPSGNIAIVKIGEKAVKIKR